MPNDSAGGAFKDHFSRQAATYAAHRPVQPAALVDWAAGLAAERTLAWDCGTGNGQAAVALAGHFERVVASDASAAQIAQAVPHARVEYRVAPAEASGLADGAVDLVTVAQALHWFDLPRFYAEARRVLAPGGALAAWTYLGAGVADDPWLDGAVKRFEHETLGDCWPPERRLVDARYRTIPFPFDEVAAPPFSLTLTWTLDALAGYLRSWSATARYRDRYGRDPVTEFVALVRERWGEGARPVCWEYAVRAGR